MLRGASACKLIDVKMAAEERRTSNFDPIAASYARFRRASPEIVRALARDTEPRFTLLEVGCGTGNYCIALGETAGCVCVGIDPSREMLAAARRRSEAISFQQGRGENLPFAKASFDLVFSVDVIHHIADRRAYFQEAHRVLRAGGRICTVTESEEMIRQRIHSFYFPETVEPELARYPSIVMLRELMAESGFGDIAEEDVERRDLISEIGGFRQQAFSCLKLIPPTALDRGIERMERDLSAGPIAVAARSLLLWATKANGGDTRVVDQSTMTSHSEPRVA